MPTQPTPTLTEADLARVVARDFPDQTVAATELLESYGSESYQREVVRVRVAAVKLARGSVEELRNSVKTACQDYRDVLAWAEYPAYMHLPQSASEAERSSAIESDWQQYQDWLTSDAST